MNQPNLRDTVKRVNDIADGVIEIADAVKKLKEGKLREKAVLILIHHASGESMKTIKKVIDSLEQLSNLYVKPNPLKGEKQ